MSPTLRQFALTVSLAALLGLLGGCMTATEGGQRNEVKVDEAVATRVAAGMKYLQMGNPSEARRHFSRALSLNDDSAQAHNAMALLYNYERDSKQEEHHYRKALSADRDYAPALNNYGTLLFSQGRYDEALEKFKRAANDPKYEGRASAFNNMGATYKALGELDRAREAYIRSLRLSPGNSQLLLELARLYYQDGRASLGWDYYRDYERRVRPQSAEALWVGIRLAADLGKRDQQASYELALQNLYPESREYRLWRAWRAGQEGDE
ncbi:type IV pilus biogenesis/stability protein PilW [Alloalcanivorax gelatiniphagus]|uniref:Type IV pilus biogenesis/stability protein PilW n=1 Tax=Alloalcanivorax gelatiniphagus TaxID=1194167 RepID=A0ABY2XLE2_9GAMM|nr:type IV pilus biogenesis/stability protein PilW [Alloalcanivorax gelatiniphagus]TMW12106.1 type IV pilus biogenesis/stability protein PilW [Alloalcanivorax gelatiniphagus]|tara:strand:+ start:2521 stop:3318 length:798 start_codon:yes stop_codon:yes gene_type:complete